MTIWVRHSLSSLSGFGQATKTVAACKRRVNVEFDIAGHARNRG